jgi:hypothetical protein
VELESTTWIGQCAGGVHDPEGVRTATIVAAYFEAEQARATRRRVWRVAAVAVLVVWAVNVITPFLTPVDEVFGAALLAGAVLASGITEWRARRRLWSATRAAGRLA